MTSELDRDLEGIARRILLDRDDNTPRHLQISRDAVLTALESTGQFGELIDEYMKPVAAELDLHLTGQSVRGHMTAAEQFGQLVTRTDAVIKRVVKDTAGNARAKAELQVTGPGPGSVRVVFKAPRPPTETRASTTTGAAFADEITTREADALRTFAALINQAELGEAMDDALDATVQQFEPATRRAIRLLAKTVIDAGWEVEGDLRKRGWETEPIRLTTRGATRLSIAAEVQETSTELVRMTGHIDGWEWGNFTMKFVPATGQRRVLRPAVLGHELQKKVLELLADPGNRVRAVLEAVTSSYERDGEVKARTSYALRGIESLPAPEIENEQPILQLE